MILRSISPACKYIPVVRIYHLRYDMNDVSMAKPAWCKQTNNVISVIVLCRTNVLYVNYHLLVQGTSHRLLSSESLLSRGTSGGWVSSESSCARYLLHPAIAKYKMLSNSTTQQSIKVHNTYNTHTQQRTFILNTHIVRYKHIDIAIIEKCM